MDYFSLFCFPLPQVGNDSQLTYYEAKHNRTIYLTFGFKIIELVPPSCQPAVGEP